MAIFVAMVLDSLDGRVARLTRTQSAFGAEYDSLTDMVSFGAAPALIMYEWALRDMGRIGWIAAFVYCAGAALRLARFNTQLSVADKRWFTGLPSPAAAALVAGMIWVFNDYQVGGGDVKWFAAAVTVYAGITMVSSVKFYSGKDINLRRAVPFSVAVVFAARAAADLDRAADRALGRDARLRRVGLRLVGGAALAHARRRRSSTSTSARRSRRATSPASRACSRPPAGHGHRPPTGTRCSWSRSRRATCPRSSCWWRAGRRWTSATRRARRRSRSPRRWASRRRWRCCSPRARTPTSPTSRA